MTGRGAIAASVEIVLINHARLMLYAGIHAATFKKVAILSINQKTPRNLIISHIGEGVLNDDTEEGYLSPLH